MDREGLNVKRATKKMKTTVRERLHKVHNYYWYTQFQMVNEDISDVSSSEEEEKCEYLDSKPDGDDSDEYCAAYFTKLSEVGQTLFIFFI